MFLCSSPFFLHFFFLSLTHCSKIIEHMQTSAYHMTVLLLEMLLFYIRAATSELSLASYISSHASLSFSFFLFPGTKWRDFICLITHCTIKFLSKISHLISMLMQITKHVLAHSLETQLSPRHS